jgi:hypothetical protein
MFIEGDQSGKAGGVGERLGRLARQYPRAFDVGLVVTMVAVTILLLLRTGYPLVLYQSF